MASRTSRPRRRPSGESCTLLSCCSLRLGITVEQYSKELLRNLTTASLSLSAGTGAFGESSSCKPEQKAKLVEAMCDINSPKVMEPGSGRKTYCSAGIASATATDNLRRAPKCWEYSVATVACAPRRNSVETRSAALRTIPTAVRDFMLSPQCCPKKVRAVHRNCLIERR